ncbi:MAG: TonB family protein [Proteobacteria bacterium]|nr:TonB family protein [Pseudomonadota bacterium]
MASAPSTAPRSNATATSPASGASARPAVDITALTTRDDFLLELGQVLDGQAAVRPVDTVEAALEGLEKAKRAQVLVIDARAVPNVRATVDTALARGARVEVLVFADGSAEKQVAAALKGSKVFAVLPTPIDARKTQAVLEGAIAEATAARAAVPARPVTMAEVVGALPPPAAAAGGTQRTPGRSKLPLIALAVCAVVAVAGGAFWYLSQGRAPASTPAAASPVAAPAAPAASATPAAPEATPEAAPVADTSILQGKVDDLLEKARLAMHERRFTEPSGDNALLYYRSAVAADPNNAEARDGLARVAGVLASRFDESLNAGRFDEAAQTLANFKAAAPGDARTAALDQRYYAGAIAKSLADGNLDHAGALVRQAQAAGDIGADQIGKWRTDIGRRVEDAKVTHLSGLVEDRIRDGRLTDSDDSAKSYLAQLMTAAPANPVTQHTQRELGAAFLRKARDAALAKNGADEERWLAEARNAGMKPADILAFQKDLTSARQKAAQAEADKALQAARDRIRDGRLTDPAQDSAAWYLGQLQTSDPANAGLAEVSRDLAAHLLDRARASLGAGRSADADLAAARRFGADPKDIAQVQQAASAKSPAAVDPATLTASLKRLRAPPPDYPDQALQKGVAGSVTLAFIVDGNGETRDVHVVEAMPPGVFDRAAVAAVKHWRYAPIVVNGSAVEVPVKTILRFELPKK